MNFLKSIGSGIAIFIKWLSGVATEPNANGGKLSFSRVVGIYMVYTIVQQSWIPKYSINSMLWDIFMVSIGYAMLSKALASIAPAILAFAEGYKTKYINAAQKKV